jgi:uncharacterized protein (TIGR02444 family)
MADVPSPGPTQPPAPADALDLDNELWRFACSFYGNEGVAPACLRLQEKLSVDVNILLFAIFAQVRRGILFDRGELRVIDGLVRDWRAEIVQPLRRLRTRLKAGPAPAPSPATDHLRNRIKAAELEAEQIELALLAAWLDRQAPRPAGPDVDAASVPLIVARYFQAQPGKEALGPEIDAALDALSGAIRAAGANKTDHPS